MLPLPVISSRTAIDREAVALHYDELDHFYRDVWGEHVHHGLWRTGKESREQAMLQLAELVAYEAKIKAGMNVCDIGCGYGATARLFAARGAGVTAITISPAQYAIAQQDHGEASKPEFIIGDWLTNDLPSESFAAAYAIESSEHMRDKARFFAQAHRVLRTPGRLVICAWLAAEKPKPWMERWLLEPICREGRMPHMGSASEYRTLGEAAGFALERYEDITQNVARTWPVIVRRLIAKLATSPRYAKFLVTRHAHNRIFALTIFRIWLAYRIGAMRYGVFTFTKRLSS